MIVMIDLGSLMAMCLENAQDLVDSVLTDIADRLEAQRLPRFKKAEIGRKEGFTTWPQANHSKIYDALSLHCLCSLTLLTASC